MAAAFLASLACAGCVQDPEPGALLETQLFRRARPPVELASGDIVAPGDELYMTVTLARPFYLYVVSEDASGGRWVVHPCRSSRRPSAAGQRHRLPLPLLGQEVFWPVQSVTPRERLLVIASEKPLALLDAAVAAAASGPRPCAALLDGGAKSWMDRVAGEALGPAGRVSASRRVGRAEEGDDRMWISTYNLKGGARHGSGG